MVFHISLMANSNDEERDMKGSNNAGYYHVCTDGAAISWMFQDDQDFIAGINRIAICHLKTFVSVIAYVLMDNHVHFVLYGTMPQCKAFITLYKRLTGKWILVKYGIGDYLKHLPTDILHINSEERLLNTIAYLDRNPLVAGFAKLPGEYPWGSARCYFKADSSAEFTKLIAGLTKNERRAVLRTRTVFPRDWKINELGMIDPLCFLDSKRVESYFKSPLRYTYFLAKKLEGIVEQDLEYSQKAFLPDKDVRAIIGKLSHELFGVTSVSRLDVKSKLLIARRLRYDYASTVKQIARLLRLDKTALEGYI